MKILARAAPHPAIGACDFRRAFDSGGDEAEADIHYTAATRAGLDTAASDRAAQIVVQHASRSHDLGELEPSRMRMMMTN